MYDTQVLKIKRDLWGGTIFMLKEKVPDGVNVMAAYLLTDELLDDLPKESLRWVVTRTVEKLKKDIDRLRLAHNPHRRFIESD